MYYQLTTFSPLCQSKTLCRDRTELQQQIRAVAEATIEFRSTMTAEELEEEGYGKELTAKQMERGMVLLAIKSEEFDITKKLLGVPHPIRPIFETKHLKALRKAAKAAKRAEKQKRKVYIPLQVHRSYSKRTPDRGHDET